MGDPTSINANRKQKWSAKQPEFKGETVKIRVDKSLNKETEWLLERNADVETRNDN
jgi:hypothetical protein